MIDELEGPIDSRMRERAHDLRLTAQSLPREVSRGRREREQLQRDVASGAAVARAVDDRALTPAEHTGELVPVRDDGAGR